MRLIATVIWILAASVGMTQDVGLEAKALSPPGWKYTASSNDGFSRPVSRSFLMDPEPPEDLELHVGFKGARQWFTQIRFGNEASVRVAFVLDDKGAGDFDLYVDRNRDRIVDTNDLIDGNGREREFDLIAEIAQEEFVTEYVRRVRFKLSISGNQFSLGTTGFVEGTASRGDIATPVRLVDGDVNGLFADERDRIWIDLNGDGRWDAITEQFPFRPMLILGEQRSAVRADRVGSQFRLEEVTGVGELRLTLPGLSPSMKVLEFSGMVYAEDGSAYAVSGLNEPLTVPIGRYTPQNVMVVIDSGEKEPWYFSFSRSNTPAEGDWFAVTADGQTEIDAIGQLRLLPGANAAKPVKSGAAIQLRPRLYTSHGLLINMSCRSRQGGSMQSERLHNLARMTLKTADGRGVSNATSGFA